MVKRVLLVGVGGQGLILFTRVLADGLLELGYDVKTSEIHGMSQRGGVVTTHVKYGEKVYAPNICPGEADLIVAFEKLEALRAVPYLKPDGTVVVDDYAVYPLPTLMGTAKYPHDAIEVLQRSLANVKVICAARTARELGNARAQNMCLLGAVVKMLKLDVISWEDHIARYVPPRVCDINVTAFNAGKRMVG